MDFNLWKAARPGKLWCHGRMDKSDKHMALLPAFNLTVKMFDFCIDTVKKLSIKLSSFLSINFNICFGCSKEPSH